LYRVSAGIAIITRSSSAEKGKMSPSKKFGTKLYHWVAVSPHRCRARGKESARQQPDAEYSWKSLEAQHRQGTSLKENGGPKPAVLDPFSAMTRGMRTTSRYATRCRSAT